MRLNEMCPACKRSPVAGKTWSLLTDQDKMIQILRRRLRESQQRAGVLEAERKEMLALVGDVRMTKRCDEDSCEAQAVITELHCRLGAADGG